MGTCDEGHTRGAGGWRRPSPGTVKLCLRPIAPAEVGGAHAVYMGVFAWLAEKGIRQWLRPVEVETFTARQARGELLGCFAGPELAAVVTLGFEASPHWTEAMGGDRQWWIKSLAVSPRFRGAGIGAYAMGECEWTASNAGAKAVYLDCVDAGFLPGYYSRAGYEEVARKEITYPSGNSFPMVLMRKILAPEGADAGR